MVEIPAWVWWPLEHFLATSGRIASVPSFLHWHFDVENITHHECRSYDHVPGETIAFPTMSRFYVKTSLVFHGHLHIGNHGIAMMFPSRSGDMAIIGAFGHTNKWKCLGVSWKDVWGMSVILWLCMHIYICIYIYTYNYILMYIILHIYHGFRKFGGFLFRRPNPGEAPWRLYTYYGHRRGIDSQNCSRNRQIVAVRT